MDFQPLPLGRASVAHREGLEVKAEGIREGSPVQSFLTLTI